MTDRSVDSSGQISASVEMLRQEVEGGRAEGAVGWGAID